MNHKTWTNKPMANSKLSIAVTAIPIFNSLGVNSPLCKALLGPILSSLSVPLTPSPKSFAKFEVIWNPIVISAQYKKITASLAPRWLASAVPVKIPERDNGRVRNLAAATQAFNFFN